MWTDWKQTRLYNDETLSPEKAKAAALEHNVTVFTIIDKVTPAIGVRLCDDKGETLTAWFVFTQGDPRKRILDWIAENAKKSPYPPHIPLEDSSE